VCRKASEENDLGKRSNQRFKKRAQNEAFEEEKGMSKTSGNVRPNEKDQELIMQVGRLQLASLHLSHTGPHKYPKA
jgi:hypothetical protein